MKNLKDQLAGIAALIAAIIAIGGGFVKYGEITTRLDALTNASKTVDLSMVAVLEEKVVMDKSKKGKVKKVIKGLKKASKLHAGQAKVLKKIIKKK